VFAAATVTNRGGTTTPAFDVSVDADPDSFVYVPVHRSQALAPGSSAVYRFALQLRPEWMTAGEKRFIVRADPAGEAAESSDANNRAEGSYIVICDFSRQEWTLVVPANDGVHEPSGWPRACAPAITPGPASWAIPVSGPAGSLIRVLANTTGNSRRTSLTVSGGRSLTVVQTAASPTCTYTLEEQAVLSSANRTYSLVTGAECPWSAESGSPLVALFPISGKGPAIIHATLYPNYSVRDIAVDAVVGNAWLRFSIPRSTLAGNERLIRTMYFNVLGREPSAGELQFQKNELDIGVPAADMIDRFLNSDEFSNGGRFVASLYTGLLGRDAEFGGWLFQRTALLSGGVAHKALAANFLNSAEWKLKFGSPDNAGFVRLLYRTILAREPSVAEVDFHRGNLDAARNDRAQLAMEFLLVPEYRLKIAARLNAFILSSTLMRRQARPEEYSALLQRIAAGTPLRLLIREIADTEEFLQYTW
jgi:hypothetical protein